MKNLTKKRIQSLLKTRKSKTTKSDYGHALMVTGNLGRMGSAVIAARACMRSGVGLLTVNVPENQSAILQTTLPEAMLVFRESTSIDWNKFAAIGIGSGIGTEPLSEEVLLDILVKATVPMILDADAINIISNNQLLVDKIPKNSILTPHSKEFDRLFGSHESNSERGKTAIKKAAELHLIIVLKSHKTLITNGIKSLCNTTGNVGLAKAGSGDALTGMITSFLAQGYSPFQAAQIGVFIHGLSADITLKNQSTESMLITDVIQNLGKAFQKISK